MKPSVGDRVRLKTGQFAGERAVVEAVEGEKLHIQLEQSASKVWVVSNQVTNYSLAARKAWVTGPDRAVGRRKGTKLTDRVSVTLRFDREIWAHFVCLEKKGLIDDRTATINAWFRDNLAKLERGEHQS